jgi:glycosyltransferase involved in cell wall biosynthesis
MLVRVVDKLLTLKGRVRLSRGLGPSAVISYLLAPPIWYGRYFTSAHNNRAKVFFMAQTLAEMGFNVDLFDYRKRAPAIDPDCSLFIGHNVHFASIAERLERKDAHKALILSGSYHHFGNEQQHIRAANMAARRGIAVPIHQNNIVPDLDANFNVADRILLLGTDFIRKTYPEKFQDKMSLFNNVLVMGREKKRSTGRNFLFMSSEGQVHRGLDLVLETFAKRSERLFICSMFLTEPEFMKMYDRELFHTANIEPVGFVKMGGEAFLKIVDQAGFCILPSCSEGQSGSLLNCMARGLIPVATANCGIPEIEKIGYLIAGDTLADVQAAVERAAGASESELAEKRERLYRFMPNFFPLAFKSRFREFMSSLLESDPDSNPARLPDPSLECLTTRTGEKG